VEGVGVGGAGDWSGEGGGAAFGAALRISANGFGKEELGVLLKVHTEFVGAFFEALLGGEGDFEPELYLG
jgi:hypothetical protein